MTRRFKITKEMVGLQLHYVVYERLPWWEWGLWFRSDRWARRGSAVDLMSAKALMENFRQRGEIAYEE